MRSPGPVLVVAEAGVNHNGSVDLARKLIDAAAEAGADAVKFQSFRAASLATPAARRAAYQVRNVAAEESQLEMLRRLELDEASQRRLFEHAAGAGIEFMSTPFDLASLRFLVEDLQVKRLKIGSGEITNAPLLLRAGQSGRPVILSTGMSTLEDVRGGLAVLAFGMLERAAPASIEDCERVLASGAGRDALRAKATLLHCTSDYPAPVEDINLLAMDTLRDAFGLPVGLSDHSSGIGAAIAAAARGAAVVEKHFTLDRSLPGPDHKASLEPAELRAMIRGVRDAVAALGSADKQPTAAELETRRVARRSLVAARDIRKGERLSAADIDVKRPADGISPMQFWDWIGKVAEKDYRKDDPL
jgi:N-acetylneuraminate synthase